MRTTLFTIVTSGAIALAVPALAKENLTAHTSAPGVAVHLTIAHLAEVAAARDIADIQITLGQTGANATLAVAEGKADIGICPFVLPFLMSKGVGPYAAMGAEKGAELASNLRILYPYSFGAYLLYAYDTVGIQGWDDLKGRRILNGPPRGGATAEARGLIQVITGMEEGKGYEGIQSDWSQMATTITEGTSDAAGKMTFWSIPKNMYESEAMQRVLGAPGSAPFTLPISQMQTLGENATIVSEDDTFRTRGSVGGNCVNASMSNDLAYHLTKAHIETLDAIYDKAPYARNIGLEALGARESGMCGPNPVKYHAGAARAWQEAGYTLPDCAK